MQTLYLDSRFQKRYPTKKSLKEAVSAGAKVTVHSESVFNDNVPDGMHTLVGPEPYKRNWYAQVRVQDYTLVSVK